MAAVGALAQRVSDADVTIGAHREAIDALGEKVSGFEVELGERFDTINRHREDDRTEAAAFRRSVEDGQEMKDLILQALDRRTDQKLCVARPGKPALMTAGTA